MTTPMFDRLKAALPPSWFTGDTPVIDSILQGFAWCASLISDNISEAKKQTRIKTASGGFLDMISGDFFGDALPRLQDEADFMFSLRILNNLLREKATFAAVYNVVNNKMQTSGATVRVYEYGSVTSRVIALENGPDLLDEGGTTMDTEVAVSTIPSEAYPVGIKLSDAAGRYNTELLPYEALVIISGAGALADVISLEDGTDLLDEDGVTTINNEYIDQTSYQFLIDAISKVKPIGTTVWLSIN